MESKGSNLFKGDRSFGQSWNLRFNESSTEKKFKIDITRFHWDSMKILIVFTALTFFILHLFHSLPLNSLILGLASILLSLPCKNLQIKRLILQFLPFLWQSTFFHKGSLPECIGALIPSLFLNFYLLNSWLYSLPLFILDGFYLNHLLPGHSLNILLSLLTVTTLASVLEKDFRDLWYLYSSYKKSNSLNQSLWDNFPGVELLVNKDGKIIYSNKCASVLLNKQNRPQEILKTGKFLNFFPDFEAQSQNLIQKSIHGETIEDIAFTTIEDQDGKKKEVSFLVTADLFSWVTGNCSRIMCIDVTTHIARKQMILTCFRVLDKHLKHFMATLINTFVQKEPIGQDLLTTFYRINCDFKGIESIQSHFSGEIMVKSENFNLNSEILNIIEVLFTKCCSQNISIAYTKEQAIPAALSGDRSLSNVVIYAILDYAITNAIEDSEIFLLAQVATASSEEITISFKVTFSSDKVKNLDIENLIMNRKNSANIKDLDQMQSLCDKYGPAVSSLDTILLGLRGYLVPVNSEIDSKKVIINICIPFGTTSATVKPNLIKIASNRIQETPLTCKWKSKGKNAYQNFEQNKIEEKEQACMMNSNSRILNNTIEFCDYLQIPPISQALQSSSYYESSVGEIDIGEASDASSKMMTYAFIPNILNHCQNNSLFNSKIYSSTPSYSSSPCCMNHPDPNAWNIVLIDEKRANFKSLGDTESLKEIFHFSQDRDEGLQICANLLKQMKKVISIIFSIDKGKDSEFLAKVKKIENDFGISLNLCGFSSVPADLNYCKSIGVINFSNIYLVVQPISYGQVCGLVTKIEKLAR